MTFVRRVTTTDLFDASLNRECKKNGNLRVIVDGILFHMEHAPHLEGYRIKEGRPELMYEVTAWKAAGLPKIGFAFVEIEDGIQLIGLVLGGLD